MKYINCAYLILLVLNFSKILLNYKLINIFNQEIIGLIKIR